MAAHTSGRTAVLYYKRQDRLGAVWENIFLPLGQACFKSSSIVKVPWPGASNMRKLLLLGGSPHV
ncbi:hypothetical protein E2C01_051725 [Portunus trituberculatus]|uniref:Uncharacterized protein n=1 Tax=Portunus trituberculatus TaxID=210409 RepID=A0A5B7GL91_PORTR|nr:hypothetical protein [Portunus trituberculatus]